MQQHLGLKSDRAAPAGDPVDAAAPLRRRLPRRLLDWFARNRREFPWRRDRDAYRIWVSEVMLQQTQAAAVIPYFERFLRTFPTLADLAAADEQDVLRLWEGLGYYRRARDLLRTARLLAATNGGRFPDQLAALHGLPGLGRYTRNAVLSQAFDRRLPILEANSVRVLTRLFGRTGDPRRGPEQRWLWAAAEALLPSRRAGDFNQALMELGALVCTPAAPRCEGCPLAEDCVARRLGLQTVIPARKPKPAPTLVREAAVVIRRGEQVLLLQRPPDGRWASLWEFPHGSLVEGEAPDEGAARLLHELTGLQGRLGSELITLRHSVTRFRITLVCFEAEYLAGDFHSAFYCQAVWATPAELSAYAVSSPQRRLAKVLTAAGRQGRLF
ncbi:MAG TPA: A/G-specific adenine glycosylase [Planctomycetales bacterium]|jgi:A/G-specific adenine glycosylase|nr:A/G-specific adenine glycosylase [Planctomycetales bacterium]